MRVTVLVNPVSGTRGGLDAGRRRAALAVTVLTPLVTELEVTITERAGHGCELARAAAARGTDRVVAWGGDGTVNEVGRGVAFSSSALGIVPGGSGNGLARALGIPTDPAAALRHAITAPVRIIDAGEIAEHLFFNIAGVGFDAHVAHAFSQGAGGRGLQRYVRVVSRELLAYRPATYRVAIDGDTTEHRAFLLSIANGPQWGNGAQIAPGARLDDGLLDVVIAEAPTALHAVWQVPRLFTGTIDRAPGVTTRRASEVTITAEAPPCLHVDGEPVQNDACELHARVQPLALRVCAG